MRDYGNQKEEFYETSDLGVITVLNMHNFKPKEFKNKGKKKIAVYDNTQELEKLVNDYLTGKLKVVAKDFNRSIRETKYTILNVI